MPSRPPVRDGHGVIADSATGTRASPGPGDAVSAPVRDGDAVIAETATRMSAEGLLPVLLNAGVMASIPATVASRPTGVDIAQATAATHPLGRDQS